MSSKRRLRRKEQATCSRKIEYPTRGAAISARNHIYRNLRNRGAELHVYPCHGHFHVGHAHGAGVASNNVAQKRMACSG